jgi:hypothetical protein
MRRPSEKSSLSCSKADGLSTVAEMSADIADIPPLRRCFLTISIAVPALLERQDPG